MESFNTIKKKRHIRILELIAKETVETQDDLLNLLRAHGFEVTQATVSRDIRELKLVKTASADGVYKYTPPPIENVFVSEKYKKILFETVISIDLAMNLVVVKTFSGMANAAATAIDHLGISGIVGSLAGDDTIFLAVASPEAASEIASDLKKILTEE